MYIKANDDLICIDKLIKAEFKHAPHNRSTLSLTYIIEGVETPTIVSEFSNISKNSIQILAEAIKNDKDYVDISKKA